MPNNFKLTGDYYVSKFGNDSWSGTSPDAPKRTIASAFAAIPNTANTFTVIIGAGVYSETLSLSNSNRTSIVFYADGQVILEGLSVGFNRTISLGTSSGSPTVAPFIFNDITFRNYSIVLGIAFQANNPLMTNFINCTIENCTLSGASTFNQWTSCKFINVTDTVSANYRFNYCIAINYNRATGSTFGRFKDSYLSPTSNIYVGALPSAGEFNFNNIQGGMAYSVASSVTSGTITDIFGYYYDLSLAGSGGTGTQLDPYRRGDTLSKFFFLSSSRIAYPTQNPSSSAVDPKFNSIEDKDFTLQADSWHIGRASDGVSNIGGTKYALRRTSRISFSGSQATVDPSLIFQYDNYIISGSQVTGSITSAPIAVNTSAPKVIQKVTYNGLLAFNKDTGSASGSNQNVPDFDTFTSASGNAAANPDRLVYYMRHTTGSSIPVSDAGWDNGGLWTAGQYNVFEWNTKPSIDNLGVGNGSGSFNAAVSPTFIQATYVQMQVKLRNDYLL